MCAPYWLEAGCAPFGVVQAIKKGLEVELESANKMCVAKLEGENRELSAEISELQGILIEQNARLEEYYDYIKEQKSEIESLNNENEM